MRDYAADFPLLQQSDLVYFDNAATTQKPKSVLDAMHRYYEKENANPMRGLYDLSIKATEDYEDARETVTSFIHAASSEEVIFTRNATESINLVAYSYGLTHVGAGDEIVVSIMEHHSNLLPWQMVCRQKGASLKFLYCDLDGRISDEEIESKITDRTKIVAVTQVSNVLGQQNRLDKVIGTAHSHGAVVVVDGAQSVPHIPVDVQALDCDFLAFSGHKMLGPMGIGVLYAKKSLLEDMPPFLSGGEMIDSVTEQSAVFAELPHKFEAGTVNAGGAVGLAEAIRYINSVGFDEITAREKELTRQLVTGVDLEDGTHVPGMGEMPEIKIIGSPDWEDHQGIISFNIDGVHPHDAASILSEAQVAIRAGHHCAQPFLKHMGVSSSLRASLYFYNTTAEVVRFLRVLAEVRGWMGYGPETDL